VRFAKLSLAAIVAIGISAFADVQNIKVDGDVKLYYSTNNIGNYDLFDKENSTGQVAVDLAASADLSSGVVGKVGVVSLSTLGLENNLVSYVWAGQTTDTVWWANEAWLAKTFGKTTLKVGRQELDTPLAFSEKWSIAANGFDAAIVLNQDISDTSLVAAWIGNGNGHGGGSVVNADGDTHSDYFRTYGSAIDDTLGTDAAGGAYTVGLVTTAIAMTIVQAWYYDICNIAQAYWLQADMTLEGDFNGLSIGAQYADIDPEDDLTTADDSTVWAVKLGYVMDNGLSVSAAYSSSGGDGAIDVANTATGLSASQTKLYTEAWWNYGYVGAPATDAYNITATYNMQDIAEFGAFYTHTSYDHTAKNATTVAKIHGAEWNMNEDIDMDELTLGVNRSFGNLDTALVYIYTDADDQNSGDGYSTVQVYLTYNF